jgi:hypothetical protein
MLNIQTFDARAGGNVLYKALAHPLAAEAIDRLYGGMTGKVAIYDPEGIAEALLALYPRAVDAVFVHDTRLLGLPRCGSPARALTELPSSEARFVLIAAFDSERAAARVRPMLPPGAHIVTLDAARVPPEMLSVPGRYLDKLNFATNFVFFRDDDRMATRLVSANYWSNHGAGAVRLWLRLFGEDGATLATWEETLPVNGGGFSIDSRQVRARFDLPPFTGQLLVHAIGVAGHDIVKYALDTFASDGGPSLSCTHDANAWPSDRFAGLPAPRADETVTLWLQNSHAVPIPAGTILLDRMGAERPVPLPREVGPFATVAVDIGAVLPNVTWPDQIEIRAGRHVVRPHAHGACQRGAGQSAARPGDRGAVAAARARLFVTVSDPGPRAVPVDRATDADGDDAGQSADPPGCLRHLGALRRVAVSGLPAARSRRRGRDRQCRRRSRRAGLRFSRRRRGGWLAARAVSLRGPPLRPRRGIEFRRAYFQHRDDLSR